MKKILLAAVLSLSVSAPAFAGGYEPSTSHYVGGAVAGCALGTVVGGVGGAMVARTGGGLAALTGAGCAAGALMVGGSVAAGAAEAPKEADLEEQPTAINADDSQE